MLDSMHTNRGTQCLITLALAAFLFVGCGEKPVSPKPSTDTPVASETTSDETPKVSTESGTAVSKSDTKDKEEARPVRKISSRAFVEAARKGVISMVKKALDQGIDVNVTDPDGGTALMWSSFNAHKEIVQELLKHGATVDHRDTVSRTALMYASSGKEDKFDVVVRLLLDAGADVNAVDSGEGFDALMMAAAEGNATVVKTLLARGADPSTRDVDGDTALDFATSKNHAEVVRILSSRK